MKKLLLFFVCLFAMQTALRADDDKPIRAEQMPQRAQQFIKAHFPNHAISFVKMESELLDKSYDVVFTNGDKAEFDKKGNWKELDCAYSEVPSAVVPAAIRSYVEKKYPGTQIVKIEKDGRNHEVKLSNGWEIEFDKHFNVIDLDR